MENIVRFPDKNSEEKAALQLPRIIGHRGAAAYAPENTLVGLHTAADMGVKWVEIDVKLSRDGEPVVFHDETLERITGTSGSVAETDWKDLKQLDAGAWFSEGFVDERIPHLEEALSVILDRGLGLNLEIKPCPGREKETAEVALDWLSRIWPEEDAPKPLISSFQAVSLEVSLLMMPEYPRGYLMAADLPETLENWQDRAAYLQAATVHFDRRFFAAEDGVMMSSLAASHYPLLCYTVNDAVEAEAMFDAGIVSVFSDRPDILDDL